MKYASDLEYEQKRLEHILEIIDEKILLFTEKSREAEEHLRMLYTANTPDEEFYSELAIAEHMNGIYKRDLEGTAKTAANPYFGKLIFSFDKMPNDEDIYLGKKGVDDYIIDWRTPIADVYYSGKMGNTSYTAPQGEVKIDLKLKSTIKIKNREISNIYDSETVVNDELLADYLSQNKGTVLNEIIATIQNEQNIIIRKSPYVNLIVQGVAGSGKTTVALHRISYLLYNFKDFITFENIYLIAGNKLFLNYITAMLPDLDIPVIKQGIMQEIFFDCIKQYKKGFKCNIKPFEDGALYDNHTFIDRLNSYLKNIEDEVFCEEGLNVFQIELLSKEQIEYYKNNRNMTLRERAKVLDGYITTKLKNNRKQIVTYFSNNKRDPEIVKFAEINFGLGGNELFETYIDKKYSKFTGNYSKYFSKKLDKINCEEEFKHFTGFEGGKEYSLNDLACLLLFYLQIKGNISQSEIKHVVIDEAQDFGVPVYYALKNLFNQASFTIVGDIMQNINRGGLDDWKTLKEEVFHEKVSFEKLLKSYRNTIEISSFAEKLMKKLGRREFDIEPLIRHGQEVIFMDFKDEEEQTDELKQLINALDSEFTAVICKDNETAEKLFNNIKSQSKVMLLNTKESGLNCGVYIMSVINSKGLEFDNVIIWDFDDYISQMEREIINRLYVAVTRALHKLYIFSTEEERFGIV